MDVSTIAATTIAILSPYLAKASEEIAKKAGDAAWKKALEIHQAVKARFGKEKNDFATQALSEFEKEPETRKGTMQDALTEILQKDPDFAASLSTLLEEAKEAGTGVVFKVDISGGEVGEVFNINKLEGGLKIDKRYGK